MNLDSDFGGTADTTTHQCRATGRLSGDGPAAGGSAAGVDRAAAPARVHRTGPGVHRTRRGVCARVVRPDDRSTSRRTGRPGRCRTGTGSGTRRAHRGRRSTTRHRAVDPGQVVATGQQVTAVVGVAAGRRTRVHRPAGVPVDTRVCTRPRPTPRWSGCWPITPSPWCTGNAPPDAGGLIAARQVGAALGRGATGGGVRFVKSAGPTCGHEFWLHCGARGDSRSVW